MNNSVENLDKVVAALAHFKKHKSSWEEFESGYKRYYTHTDFPGISVHYSERYKNYYAAGLGESYLDPAT